MAIWFTADTHFFHERIIEYCDRPYRSVEEMNAGLLEAWNSRVAPGDQVYHLGDMALYRRGREGDIFDLVSQLHGQIHLLRGNHDRDKAIRLYRGLKNIVQVRDYLRIKIQKQRLVLFHYAMRVWHGSHRGAWHLYGHSHGTLSTNYDSLSFDVGVDVQGYRPISFEEVQNLMTEEHKFVPVDHHGSDDEAEEI